MLNTPLAGSIAHALPNPLSSLLAFQAETVDSGQMNHLVIFVGIAAISLAIVALFFLVAAIGALFAYLEVSKEIKLLRKQATDLIEKSQSLMAEFTPQVRQITAKVDTITGHVEHLAALAHEKADEFSPTISAANQTVREANESVRETVRSTTATVQDANNKTRAQVSRVDGMISTALDSVVRIGVAIEHGITRPGREVAGVIAGLKAGFETLASAASRAVTPRPSAPRPSAPRPTSTRPTSGPVPTTSGPVSEAPRPIYPVPVKPDSDF